MDSTLFDYKNISQQDLQKGVKGGSRPQRPMSAQNQKFSQHALSPTTNDGFHGGNMPQIAGNNRNRPTTAMNRQNYNGNQSEMNKPFPQSILEELLPEEEDKLIEKAAYAEPIQLLDFQKIMPKHITLDKERLYEDTLHLKQLINALREENLKVKTKNLQVERENAKLAKALERVGNNAASFGKPVESALIVTLKNQVKEMRDELKLRHDEIEGMKRSTKVTKFQELDFELRAFADENVRLKNKFEELKNAKPQIKPEDYNALEERYLMQTSLIETLQRDHARLSNDLKYLEEENYRIQVARDQETSNSQKQQAELVRLRRQLKDTKNQLNTKLDIANLYNKTATATQKPDDKSKDNTINDLKRKLAEKDQTSGQKDQLINELQQKLTGAADDKQDLDTALRSLRGQHVELESKYRALLNAGYSSEGKKSSTHEPINEKRERPQTADKNDKKVKRVTSNDVESIGYEISVKLRLRGIPLDDVMTLFDQCGPKLSIYNMKEILQHGDSFGLKDNDAALLVARYLVEPIADKPFVFDGNKTQDVKNIKNLFKDLVGNYNLLDEDEASMMDGELSEVISRYGETLRTHFSMLPGAKTGLLGYDQIARAFVELEIELSEKTMDYLVMSLYEYTDSVTKMNYMKMFEIFENQRRNQMDAVYHEDEEEDNESQPSERKVKFADKNTKQPAKGSNTGVNANNKKATQEEAYEQDDDDYDEYDEDDEPKGKEENDEDDEEYGEDYEN